MLDRVDELVYGTHLGLYGSIHALSSLVIMGAIGFIGVVGLAESLHVQTPVTIAVGVLGGLVAVSGALRR